MRINHHYIIPYKEVNSFAFIKYNLLVDETCYLYRILFRLDKIIKNLVLKPNSRREIIMTHNNVNDACLTSVQFQIVRGKLIVIASFRSQCEVNGRPYDTEMLQYVSTIVMKALVRQGLRLSTYKIYCNVANYHVNTTIPPQNDKS